MLKKETSAAQVTVAPKVAFDVRNVTRCLCPQCEVQKSSQDVSSKMAKIKQALKKQPLNREDIPGMYCATGEAICKGLDPDQICSCYDCPVYADYNLAEAKPPCYYCQHGVAELAA